MPRISVIVPVYNTEKYIGHCLESILNQEYEDFEIIVVNDGSNDCSEEIVKKYIGKYPDKIRYYSKVNGGLSDARNYGVDRASGDYICFVDSDDYIGNNLFKSLDRNIQVGVDLIKYKCIKVDEKYKEIERVNGPTFEIKTGQEAFNELYSKDVLMETAWLYLYRRNFWIENNFKFPVNKYHEDWAIVPYIIVNAKTVTSTDVYGYYYVQSPNSITRNNTDGKIKKRAYDMLEHYDNIINCLSEDSLEKITLENFKIYMSNCLILKLYELPEEYHKDYIDEMKKRKIFDNIRARNVKQLMKKIVLKLNVKLYLKIR